MSAQVCAAAQACDVMRPTFSSEKYSAGEGTNARQLADLLSGADAPVVSPGG